MPTVFITSGTTWNVPLDFDTLVSIECIGAGSAGIDSSGGGGGGYSRISSLALTPGQSITIQVGTGTTITQANNDTWFNGASLAASSVGAQGGGATAGGAAASGVGVVRNSGGAGGAGSGGSGGGGGGAGSPNGSGAPSGPAGVNAGAGGGGSGGGTTGGSVTVNSGGNGGNNYLGVGGGAGGKPGAGSPGTNGGGGGGSGNSAVIAGAGGAGTEYDATHGSGGGAGGAGGSTTGASGGLYGGGGGGRTGVGAGAGVGGAGLIVFTYIAASPLTKKAATAATLMAAAISAPWGYVFLGGAQPYAPKKNAPSLIESVVNDPPFQHPGRTVQQTAIAVQQWQPPEWPYAFMGNAQPYMGPRINPDTASVQANDPPFDMRRGANLDAIISLWQPDPYVPTFMGRWQPFEGRKLPPSTILVPEVDPPFRHPGRLITTEIAQRGYQPEIWPYVFSGGRQPYAPARLPPDVTAVPENDPPFGIPNKSILANIVGEWQPEIWPYVFMGRQQPYEGKKLPVDVSLVPEDNPPFTHRGRTVNLALVTATWQPDPWVYAFMGGKGPFVPIKLSPGVPGQAVDNPPFRHPSRTPQPEIAERGYQPAIWPYVFMGGRQPYQRGNLTPSIINVPIQVDYQWTVRNQILRLDNVVRGQGRTGNFPNDRNS